MLSVCLFVCCFFRSLFERRVEIILKIYSKTLRQTLRKGFYCSAVKCTLPTNGILLGCNTNSTEMSLGAECRFSCKERAEEIGSTVRKCSENGTWSGVDLVCAGIRFTNTYFWRVLPPCTIDDLGRRISLRSSIVFPRLAAIVDRDSWSNIVVTIIFLMATSYITCV